MLIRSADLAKGPAGDVVNLPIEVVPPTRQRTIVLDLTGVGSSVTDRPMVESASRDISQLPKGVVAPTGQCAITPETAGMESFSADLIKGAARGVQLPAAIVPPTGD